jgi:hypothetical protein
MFTWSIFVATTILGAPPSAADPVTPCPSHQAAKDSLSVQEILTNYEKHSNQEYWKVRMECLVNLIRIGPTAVPDLIECLKNEKAPSGTRAIAAQALGFLADPRARPVLLQAIEDQDGGVRADAEKALGRLGRVKETPKLRKLAGTDTETGHYFNMMFLLTRDDRPDPEPIHTIPGQGLL